MFHRPLFIWAAGWLVLSASGCSCNRVEIDERPIATTVEELEVWLLEETVNRGEEVVVEGRFNVGPRERASSSMIFRYKNPQGTILGSTIADVTEEPGGTWRFRATLPVSQPGYFPIEVIYHADVVYTSHIRVE